VLVLALHWSSLEVVPPRRERSFDGSRKLTAIAFSILSGLVCTVGAMACHECDRLHRERVFGEKELTRALILLGAPATSENASDRQSLEDAVTRAKRGIEAAEAALSKHQEEGHLHG
jgi:hypothetical protein